MKEVKLFFNDKARQGDYPWVAEVHLNDGPDGSVRGYGVSVGEALDELEAALEDL